jgi:hypothetical protein
MSTDVNTGAGEEADSLAPVMDSVCEALHAGYARGERFTRLYLSPRLYQIVADSKAREIARGNPVMVLSLDVEPDDSLPELLARLA